MKALKPILVLAVLTINFSIMASAFQAKPSYSTASGTVVSVESGSITIHTVSSESTFKVDSSVQVYFEHKSMTLSDVDVDDKVELRYTDDGTVRNILILAGGPCKKHPELPQCHHH